MAQDNQITANVGLYYVCYHLSRQGWNVMPTARNARGIDIVAYDKSAQKFLGIQVKALSKRHAVPLGKSLEKIMGDYWIIVNNISAEPNVFIMLPEEVKKSAVQSGKRNGKVAFWLDRIAYELEAYKDAWQRLKVSVKK